MIPLAAASSLFPHPSSSKSDTKSRTPEYFLTVPGSDIKYPTDGFGVWDAVGPIQRDPTLWARPNDFVPERWLAKPGQPLHVPQDIWRPFSAGHRICIGQDLALTEAKLLAVFLGRRFDIEEAWGEWDVKQ